MLVNGRDPGIEELAGESARLLIGGIWTNPLPASNVVEDIALGLAELFHPFQEAFLKLTTVQSFVVIHAVLVDRFVSG